jgi:hypothetical protein
MSTVTTLLAKEKNGPSSSYRGDFDVAHRGLDFETDSYKQFGKDRFLTTPLMQWMYDMYIADPEKAP